MPQKIVGQTVRFSSKKTQEQGHSTRSIFIHSEIIEEGKRYYYVRDEMTHEYFYVLADKYDEFFLVRKSGIAPKNHRIPIRNTGNADYKK